MEQHAKNQHYIPQFLLRNFSSRGDKFIWTYDREKKYGPKNQERPIKKVASEQFFYDQVRNNKSSSLEYILQEIETQTAPIINNIIKSKTIKSLSEKDRKTLSFFVTVQLLRTKGSLNELGHMINIFDEQMLQKINIQIEKIDTKELWFSFIEDAKIYSDFVANKVWMLTESNEAFLISDHPVVLQNSSFSNEYVGTLGLDCYGIEIYFPLTHSLTLCIFCEKLFQNSGYTHKYIDNLISPPESILNLNFLQVAHSYRFIFSHIDNSDLIKDLLEKTKKKF